MAAHRVWTAKSSRRSGDLEGAIAAFEAAVEHRRPEQRTPNRQTGRSRCATIWEPRSLKRAEPESRQRRCTGGTSRWNQNNGWALFGLWKSLEAQGQTAAAEEARAAYEASWQNSDVTLARSRI